MELKYKQEGGMARKVKIAIAQTISKLGDIVYNVEKSERYIRQAAKQHSDIICFPELFITGYNLELLKDNVISSSRKYHQFTYNKISQAAKTNKIHVIASFVDIKDDKSYIMAILFGPDGEEIGHYYKSHGFAMDKKYFEQGTEYPVFQTSFGNIGILVCYDIGFPETARTLCLKGAEIIFIPSAWRIQEEHVWDLNIPSRALENQLFTVGVNRAGHEEDLHLFGRSKVCNPFGQVVFEMDYDTEELGICQIDLDEIKQYRSWGYLVDRRPEIYIL